MRLLAILILALAASTGYADPNENAGNNPNENAFKGGQGGQGGNGGNGGRGGNGGAGGTAIQGQGQGQAQGQAQGQLQGQLQGQRQSSANLNGNINGNSNSLQGGTQSTTIGDTVATNSATTGDASSESNSDNDVFIEGDDYKRNAPPVTVISSPSTADMMVCFGLGGSNTGGAATGAFCVLQKELYATHRAERLAGLGLYSAAADAYCARKLHWQDFGTRGECHIEMLDALRQQ